MSVVAITGVSGRLGRLVVARLESSPDVRRVIGIDVEEPVGSPKLEFHQIDVRDARLAKALVGVDAVVHLAYPLGPSRDEQRARSLSADGTRNILEAIGVTGVGKVICLSSGEVYGARPDNDVPLGEGSPLRPNGDSASDVLVWERERLLDAFAARDRDVIVTVLRTAPVFGAGTDSVRARMLGAPRLLTVDGYEPPFQVVHEDDLADAIALATGRDLPGAYNVAADGWLSHAELRSVVGKKAARVPEEVAFAVVSGLWRARIGPVPPQDLYPSLYPLVLDNAKLRSEGWVPSHGNRETVAETIAARRGWVALGGVRIRRSTLARLGAIAVGLGFVASTSRRARRR